MQKNLFIAPSAIISESAKIYPSLRESKIIIGAHTYIYDFVVIKAVGGMGDINIGEHCYINPGSSIYSGHGVSLGNYVLIGPNCVIVGSNHESKDRNLPIRKQGFALEIATPF